MYTTTPTSHAASVKITLTLPDGTIIEQTKPLPSLGNPRYWVADADTIVSSTWKAIRAALIGMHGKPLA